MTVHRSSSLHRISAKHNARKVGKASSAREHRLAEGVVGSCKTGQHHPNFNLKLQARNEGEASKYKILKVSESDAALIIGG